MSDYPKRQTQRSGVPKDDGMHEYEPQMTSSSPDDCYKCGHGRHHPTHIEPPEPMTKRALRAILNEDDEGLDEPVQIYINEDFPAYYNLKIVRAMAPDSATILEVGEVTSVG